ncbi:MAG: FAD-binding protein [Firmicutes bacterium]|nr:FAD-binding protein [Bacillota bacterium]
MKYDVIIVGAGPAGSVLAWKLPKDLSVLLIDKRHLLDPEKIPQEAKCCGGMLDHSAQKELAHLGLPLPREVIMPPQIFTVRAIDFDSRMERYYQRNYLNIDRGELDAFLVRKAEERENVRILGGASVFRVEETENEVTVSVRTDDGKTEEYRADYLVGCDGASSVVRRYIMEKYHPRIHAPKVYASIQEWHKVTKPVPYYGAMFDHRVTDYYSWIIPKTVGEDSFLLLGSAIPSETNVKERFEILRADMALRGFDFQKPVKTTGAVILRPKMCGSICTGKSRIFLCGEASGLISPSSSEGISFALRSGEALAKVWSGRAGSESIREGYEKKIRHMKMSIAIKSLKSPVMYKAPLRRLVFRTRALSMKVLKDTERWT